MGGDDYRVWCVLVCRFKDRSIQLNQPPFQTKSLLGTFHFGEGKYESVLKTYTALKDGAEILYPLSPCEHSALMVDLIGKYGVRWCIFVLDHLAV